MMKSPRSAFSLVEVTIAIGIVSFALLAILGLLPIGLKSVKEANAEIAAANAINKLAAAIRDATTTDSTNYVAGGGFTNIRWSGTSATSISGTLSPGGVPFSGGSDDQAFAYHLEIHPPSADRTRPGRVRISVAWPSTAVWGATNWSQAQGFTSTGMQFLPR